MSLNRIFIVCLCLLHVAPAISSADSPVKVLRAYGPGGPHHVLEECANLFLEKSGVDIKVIKALPHNLETNLPMDGDLYFGGAEYMLEDFNRLNPGVIDVSTTENLYPRRIGIIVRKGNPLDIKSVDDLKKDGVAVLDVKLEKMRHFHLDQDDRIGNIRHHEYTGRQGVDAWLSSSEIDAWITYKSWHISIADQSDFIEIPGDHAVRYTPIALTHRTPHQQEAMNFIHFLKSSEAQMIFDEHGWN